MQPLSSEPPDPAIACGRVLAAASLPVPAGAPGGLAVPITCWDPSSGDFFLKTKHFCYAFLTSHF